MTISATGNISLTDVQTEFGGSNPIGISEYYNADPFLPVPSSGEISLNNFRGANARTAGVTVRSSDAVIGQWGFSAANGGFYYGAENTNDKTAFGAMTKTYNLLDGGKQICSFLVTPAASGNKKIILCQRGDKSDSFGGMIVKVKSGDYAGNYTLYAADATYQSVAGTSPQAYAFIWTGGQFSEIGELYSGVAGNSSSKIAITFTSAGRNR